METEKVTHPDKKRLMWDREKERGRNTVEHVYLRGGTIRGPVC